ncbi:MAG: hypothetical protein OES32_17405 [Acidobacteriota bacterium]|nr:hypothetical protein [Acidobacteriota bacterium]
MKTERGLVELEIETVADEVEALRRELRARVDGLEVELEAVKRAIGEGLEPAATRRFLRRVDEIRREIVPERGKP